MVQKLYKEVSHNIPQSSLDEWEKISKEIEKIENSLFKYEATRWVKEYIEKEQKNAKRRERNNGKS